MTLQTYTIELKLDSDSDEGHAAMTEIMKQYARDMVASAMLLQGKRAPQVICRTMDRFYDTTEVEALDPSEEFHRP